MAESNLKGKVAAASKTEQKNNRLKAQIDKLNSTIDLLEKQLHKARESRVRLKIGGTPSRKPFKSKDGTFHRVIIPDSHGCYIDEQAASAFINDLRIIQPQSIVMLGDHLDCGGFLAEHHTIGYVAEMDYSYADDCNAANQFLDAIQSACPNAEIDYLEGNHERRIEKWIVTQTRRHSKDARLLRDHFGTEKVLNLEKRGVKYFAQGVMHEGLTIPATIRRDNCYFTHGEFTAKNAAAVHLAKYNSNVWLGHVHRHDVATKRTVKDGVIGAWIPGCLCRLQPLWMHTNLTDWSHGYGLQIVKGGFGHLNITVPIINGVSYLAPLIDSASRGKKS